ncbi:MAG: ATP synthase F1 subunit delta [Saprospiraceae bacterium]|nr:ATP synthase F1 subunit delta [Saprospiraceae bacterium]MBK8451313.1 ATP synthase F1 subunit delta [Saprospiraceae bacterium]
MSQIQIAERYAKSLIQLAQEQNILSEVFEDINTVAEVCKHPEFNSMLKSPVIYSDKKIAIFKQLFEGKIQALSMRFFHLLMEKGRESVIAQICHAFIEQFKVIKKIKTARIITATELSIEELEHIKSRFSFWLKAGETMQITQKLDPKLIGGFIMEMGDQNCDASIKRQLAEMKESLYDKSYISLVEKR